LKNKTAIFKIFIKGFPFFWITIIAILSLLPDKEVDKVWFDFIIPPDKIAHFVLYAILSFSLLFNFLVIGEKILSARLVLYIALFSISYGILLEFLQELDIVNRNASFYDVLANLSGILFGITVYFFVKNKIKLKLYP